MTTLTHDKSRPFDLETAHRRPGIGRRVALVVTGFLACALPIVFTVNISRMLLTGAESDHRFHQATGQGLILFALRLVPLFGLLRVGWRGERPSTALGYQHLAFVGTGITYADLPEAGYVTSAAGAGEVRRANPIRVRTMPSTNAINATPKATTEVNSDACRNAESIAVARFGSSWSSSA
jgi:hypothetical protein